MNGVPPAGTAPAQLPVVVVGAGPIGLITALGLVHHGVPVLVVEQDDALSADTKAGTVLTRTVEVLHRYGAAEPVLAASLRIDEIGDLDRATDTAREPVRTCQLTEDTRFPFVLNIPQHHLEPILRSTLQDRAPAVLRFGHRLRTYTQLADRVRIELDGPDGPATLDAAYLLGCDGGRSTVRAQMGVPVEGHTLAERYVVVDVDVDLDVVNPRDYPYLAYFGDPAEWMVLVRLPHCWRVVFPLAPGAAEPDAAELTEKARRFIGDVDHIELVGTTLYTVHHRVAQRWQDGRVLLLGDAAHLITPMWALGLNTGVLDASNLPWRLAWVLRGWADPELLAGYEAEQRPLAVRGSGEMAEAARAYMARRTAGEDVLVPGSWGAAFTRTLLGVGLDVSGGGDVRMVRTGAEPTAVLVGDRVPDLPLVAATGPRHLHDLVNDRFGALIFTDARRRPAIEFVPSPALARWIVSRWDAPPDSGLRRRTLFDPGNRVRARFGIAGDAVVLVRPDGHVAAIEPLDPDRPDQAGELYRAVTARPAPPTEERSA